MKKRITVNMIKKAFKENKINKEKAEEITSSWKEEIKNDKKFDERIDYYMEQFLGALFLKDIPDKTRMEIIQNTIDKIALKLFTQKAWEMVKQDTIKGINEDLMLNWKS